MSPAIEIAYVYILNLYFFICLMIRGLSNGDQSKNIDSNNTSLEGELENLKNEEPVASGEALLNYTSHTNGNDELNITENNVTKTSNASQVKRAACIELEDRGKIGDVEILDATGLQKILISHPNITTRSTSAPCYLIYFFSPYCPYSTQGSAYVNALARSLPNIPVYGFDSITYHSFNARYGIMGTPSLVLFHNGNVAGRYNASEYSTYFLEAFVHHFTDQTIHSINVTSNDFKSSLPSEIVFSAPYALYIAWAFLVMCGCYMFVNSELYAKLTETFVNNWREAEAQHEHDD